MELAEYLQVPVTPTYMAKGSIPELHPLYAGNVGIQTSHRFANQLFLESDFVLAVGARFAERHTGDLDVYRGDRTFVHIDIEPGQIGRVFLRTSASSPTPSSPSRRSWKPLGR